MANAKLNIKSLKGNFTNLQRFLKAPILIINPCLLYSSLYIVLGEEFIRMLNAGAGYTEVHHYVYE